MNDNMSVYSYRELYPISLVLTKKGLNVVQIQVFLFFSVQLHFVMFVELNNILFLI